MLTFCFCSSHPRPEEKFVDTVGMVTLNASKSDSGRRIECRAINQFMERPFTTFATLDVQCKCQARGGSAHEVGILPVFWGIKDDVQTFPPFSSPFSLFLFQSLSLSVCVTVSVPFCLSLSIYVYVCMYASMCVCLMLVFCVYFPTLQLWRMMTWSLLSKSQ